MPLDPKLSASGPSAEREAEMAMRGAMLRSGPVFIIPRQIPGGVAGIIDDLSPEALPRLRYEGPADGLKSHLRRAIAERLTQPRWLANWLVHDVVDKAEFMAQLTGAPALRVRLEVVDDDHCRKFHVDDVRLRLVTTYRGPGTEWVAPRLAVKLAPGGDPPAHAIRHLGRGHVAVMRGRKGSTPEAPGILHRSPPIAGTGVVRLFLAIDELGRRLH